MSDEDPQTHAVTKHHPPLTAWLVAAFLFIFGIKLLSTADR